jgi:indoleacetamide hydrolase
MSDAIETLKVDMNQQNDGTGHDRRAAELAELTATEAADHIKEGSLTAEGYATALLRVCEANRDLKALTWMSQEALLGSARRTDQARARGEALGPLTGIPMVVKDNIDTVGFPTSAATAALKDNHPKRNAPIVDALVGRGAYVFAKANMHELAGGGTSSNPVFGSVRNPYDRARVAGGSSGGTAAAIAARMAPIGLGTDTAGSVRIPSAFCGTVGLRPTSRLYSSDGIVPLALDLDTAGPMARCVADVALMHAAVTGDALPQPVRLDRIRVGIPRRHYWEELDPEVERVTQEAVERLREQGVTFVEVDAGAYLEEADAVFWTFINVGLRDDLRDYLQRNNMALQAEAVIDAIASKDTRRLFALAREADVAAELVTQSRGAARARIVQAYEAMFRAHDISAVAFPTEALGPPFIKAGGDEFEDEVEVNGKPVNKVEILIRNTRLTCALGAPGLSLPAGLTAQGLPVGFELDGLPGNDMALLGLGLSVEATLGRLPAPKLMLQG